jgi:hypothetical protein
MNAICDASERSLLPFGAVAKQRPSAEVPAKMPSQCASVINSGVHALWSSSSRRCR